MSSRQPVDLRLLATVGLRAALGQAVTSMLDTGAHNLIDARFPIAARRFIHCFEQRGRDSGNKGISATRRIDYRRYSRCRKRTLIAVGEHCPNRSRTVGFDNGFVRQTFRQSCADMCNLVRVADQNIAVEDGVF